MMFSWPKKWLVLTLASVVCEISFCRTFVKVDANEELCFFEDLKKMDPLVVTFQVMEGGYLDIDARILSPSNEALYSQERVKEGTKRITAQVDGRYTICFGNTMSTMTAKLVSFGIHAGHGELVSHEVAKQEHIYPIQTKVLELADKVTQLKDLEQNLKARSARHKQTADSTNKRSLYTSMLESVVLVSVNLWQIYYLRQFFEVKRYI
uniref:GOLD domain-containing protein n=1 Tax=Aplanochytrium stocchinoi TaxID=215587 RepID=A0A7S3PI52_9STRA|mmetsp:Transcript_26739/g.32415  ORF Transcript_26739/g.32415 Transcript_26739/m.32415 type:complete len:208 (+) Transcript_26739:121-744(+)